MFPDVNSACLQPGALMNVGPFEPGTWVGFYMVADGCNDPFSPTKYYSISAMNNDGRRVASFVDPQREILVLGFADDSSLSFNSDYDDIIFAIDISYAFIDYQNVPLSCVPTCQNAAGCNFDTGRCDCSTTSYIGQRCEICNCNDNDGCTIDTCAGTCQMNTYNQLCPPQTCRFQLPGQNQQFLLDVAGWSFYDLQGAPVNFHRTLRPVPDTITGTYTITGFSYDVSITTNGASWFAEDRIRIVDNSGVNPPYDLSFSTAQNGGTQRFTASVTFSPPWTMNGPIDLELYETYDDINGGPDSTIDPSSTITWAVGWESRDNCPPPTTGFPETTGTTGLPIHTAPGNPSGRATTGTAVFTSGEPVRNDGGLFLPSLFLLSLSLFLSFV